MVLRNMDWYEGAACRGDSEGDWFPEGRVDDGRTTYVPAAVRRAITVCRLCPVVDACREYALEANEKVGVWGGMLSHERRSLRRQRQRAALRERRGV
jgi:WhiB family redox-sensing transcriptional regulator